LNIQDIYIEIYIVDVKLTKEVVMNNKIVAMFLGAVMSIVTPVLANARTWSEWALDVWSEDRFISILEKQAAGYQTTIYWWIAIAFAITIVSIAYHFWNRLRFQKGVASIMAEAMEEARKAAKAEAKAEAEAKQATGTV
jgi:hypothetical protein